MVYLYFDLLLLKELCKLDCVTTNEMHFAVRLVWDALFYFMRKKQMTLYNKSIQNIEFFKMLYNDDILRMKYKYITSISVSEDDIEKYRNYLKDCERMGFSYYLYLLRDRMIGFLDFALREMSDSDIIDLSSFSCDEINKIFCNIFKEDGYFLVSDNSINANSYEEKVYRKICDRLNTSEDKPTLRLLK